ncbi:hypothetical protein GQ43DRAFT_419127 [Delitschia confertaspora ATCC 74209]|uniref:Uncharacterized protein n=1 Tax=Delitschia confertaspora ATCC 74209 TaxID=1513339 RepID=A0A9P4JMP3_9PLEO|nr:hypothetical protein GQ43DRAFT_419127 [Delitschia confertaspora ATCC 74209]
MVLQDVPAPESDGFQDQSSYPSDNDPYEPSSSSPASYQIDFNQMPKPIPVLAPMFGFSEAHMRKKIDTNLKIAEQLINRRLAQSEANRLAYYILELEKTKSYTMSLGAAFGIWRAYKTMDVYRYPFYLPTNVDPNKFLFVRGAAANYARHSWRFAVYFIVSSQIGKAIGQGIAQPLAAQKTSSDPQLNVFVHDVRYSRDEMAKKAHAEWVEKSRTRPEAHVAGPKEGMYRGPQRPVTTPSDDDMSPTSGNEPWPTSSSGSSWTDENYDELGSQASKSQPQPPSRSAPTTWGRRQPPSRSASSDDDDMSPTGGMFQDDAEKNSSSGSAWDRLRRGGGPPARQQPAVPREQAEGSTLGDSWTFADSNEERQREKEKAQREFDERIERERRGGDFNEGGSGKKGGWGW